MLRIEYKGGHRFDWDSDLEEIAGKPRSGSGMDFESDVRWIDIDVPEEDHPKFRAVVKHAFPEFIITAR